MRPLSREEASLPELARRLESDPAAMAGRMRTRYGDVNAEGMFVETGKEGLSPVQDSRKNAMEGQLAQAEDALARNDLTGAEDVLKNGAPKLPGLPGEEEAPLPGREAREDEGVPGGRAPQGAESAQEALKEGECQTCEERKYQDGSDDMGVSFQTPTNIKPEQAASAVRGHEKGHVVAGGQPECDHAHGDLPGVREVLCLRRHHPDRHQGGHGQRRPAAAAEPGRPEDPHPLLGGGVTGTDRAPLGALFF